MQKICLIIPCYNEAERFDQNHFLDFVNANHSFDFCLVNDGSEDNTDIILAKLARLYESRIDLLNLKRNVGKAEAIRKAFLFCADKNRYDYIGYIDADFSAPLTEINHIIAFCKGELNHSIIAGSRVKRLGARIIRRPTRHYLGRIFATLGGWLLKLPIYDSQCGLKLIQTSLAKELFTQPFITRWLFDLELWFRFRNLVGLEAANLMTLEIPLSEWEEKGGSKIKFINFLRVPVDLIRIHLKYNLSAIKIEKKTVSKRIPAD